MNDVISLDSVRRGRSRSRVAGAGAGGEPSASQPAGDRETGAGAAGAGAGDPVGSAPVQAERGGAGRTGASRAGVDGASAARDGADGVRADGVGAHSGGDDLVSTEGVGADRGGADRGGADRGAAGRFGTGGASADRGGASRGGSRRTAAQWAESADPVEFPAPVELSDAERLDRVSDTVVRALGRRQLSAAEAHELLVAQGATGSEADVLVARYEELGYLNDLALAESLVERLSERSHKSRAVIVRELGARKIPSEHIAVALEQLDDDQEFELALEAALKRAGQLSSYDEQTAERRLTGFLARRGYASAVVREVTRQAMATRRSTAGPRFR